MNDDPPWLYVGSSSELPQHYGKAVVMFSRFTATITTNHGIRWMRTPDFCYLVKQDTPEYLEILYREAQARGTTILSLPHNSGVHYADERIDLDHGRYLTPQTSGLTCLEIACNKGATTLILVGATGYPAGPPAYFDGEGSFEAWQAKASNKRAGMITTQICTAWPQVQFVCIGQPRYTVNAPNWIVIDE